MMNILDELIADHQRLHSLLILFERELAAYEADKAPDLQLMHDVVSHYAEYFNRFHHPLEDCLFEHLLNREPRRNASTHSATSEHDGLRRATARLLAALDRVLHDTMVTRAELAESGRHFLQRNRDHMRHEESLPFKRARQCLTTGDWHAIDIAAHALRSRIDLERGRRHYDAILATLRTVQPAISAAGHPHAAQGLPQRRAATITTSLA